MDDCAKCANLVDKKVQNNSIDGMATSKRKQVDRRANAHAYAYMHIETHSEINAKNYCVDNSLASLDKLSLPNKNKWRNAPHKRALYAPLQTAHVTNRSHKRRKNSECTK